MKKILAALFSLVCTLACAFGLAACDFGGNGHTHDYVRKYDETYHWQECTNDGCNAKTKDRAAHSFGADNRCTVCNYEKGAVIADKLSVTGYSYVFSSVEVECNSESLYGYAEMIQAQMQSAYGGSIMAFYNDGTCTMTVSGSTQSGAYTQSGAKVTVTANGETDEMTATEKSVILSKFVPFGAEESPDTPSYPDDKDGEVNYPDYSETEIATPSAAALSFDEQIGFTVTITYVKGSGGNNPVMPDKPDNECKHIYRYNSFSEYTHMAYCDKCGDKKGEPHMFGEDGKGNVCIYCDYHKKDTPDLPDVPDTPDSVEYTLNSDGKSYSISKKFGFSKTVFTIPAEYNGKPVTSISDSAFSNCSELTSITIPDSVTNIGNNAFYNCSLLEKINYTGGIVSWCGINGLYNLTLSKVYIGNQKLQEMTGELVIPNGVTYIGGYAFSGCSKLTSITIPESVTSIGNGAFYNCSSIERINYTGGIASWCSINGLNQYFPISTVYIGNRKLQEMTGKLVIPNGVTNIGSYVFHNCSKLTSITIPDSITSIGYGAFSGCSGLTSITIPSNVTYVGSEAFSMCENLKTVYWNAKNCEAGFADIQGADARGIFYKTDITDVVIGNEVTNIRETTFYGCSSLTSVTIPDSVTSIGDFAFEGCRAIERINYTGDIASWCGIDGLGNLTFSKVYISDQKLQEMAGELIIPNGVTRISKSAFYGCSKLTSITIPGSVTSIDNYAFYGCNKLADITFNGTTEQWNAITKDSHWDYNTGNYTIHCTDGDLAKEN